MAWYNDFFNFNKPQPEKGRIIDTLYKQQLQRVKQDINKWRTAVRVAESVQTPSRYQLMQLYQDIVLDAHLSALMSSRKNKCLSKDWGFFSPDGTRIKELDKMVNEPWFVNTLEMALDSRFYGYSLIQYGEVLNDNFRSYQLVPRQYVLPEFGIVTQYGLGSTGISYKDQPYSDWCLGFGDERDLGLLMKAAPLVIYKKFIMGNWSEFAEVFGMPYRQGKTNVRDAELMKNMQAALQNMGSNGWGVFDTDDSIEFLEVTRQDAYKVYDQFIERINGELSKLILGQTGTTDMGKNRGSDDVHENVSDEWGERDEWFISSIVTNQFVPFLRNLGFKISEDAVFSSEKEEKLEFSELSTFVTGLLQYGEVDETYILDTFGVPFKKSEEPKVLPAGGTGAKKSSTITNELHDFYHLVCCGIENKDKDVFQPPYNEEETNNWLHNIYVGFITVKNLDPELYRRYAEILTKGVEQGFGEFIFEFGSPDVEMLAALKRNVWVFSGAKSFQLTKEVNAMIFDEFGVKREFPAFKKAVQGIIEHYNVNYLKAEYHQAIAASQSARQWIGIQKDKKTLPYLKYQTVGDGRVRAEHKVLDNIVKKVDDSFWNKYMPPNGWNCRCIVIQLSELDLIGNSLTTDTSELEVSKDEVPTYFRFNPGKKQMAFSPGHPYFKVGERYKPIAEMNFNLPIYE